MNTFSVEKFYSAFAAVLLFALLLPMSVFAEQEKDPVCHLNDEGGYQLFDINDSEFATHLAHGDGEIGGVVPHMPGYTFDDSCEPERTGPNPSAGCYDNALDPNMVVVDYSYSGVANTKGNVTSYASGNGTCTTAGRQNTLVNAYSKAEAVTICASLGSTSNRVLNYKSMGYSGFPTTAWACNSF